VRRLPFRRHPDAILVCSCLGSLHADRGGKQQLVAGRPKWSRSEQRSPPLFSSSSPPPALPRGSDQSRRCRRIPSRRWPPRWICTSTCSLRCPGSSATRSSTVAPRRRTSTSGCTRRNGYASFPQSNMLSSLRSPT
jgi:hypothetical protein